GTARSKAVLELTLIVLSGEKQGRTALALALALAFAFACALAFLWEWACPQGGLRADRVLSGVHILFGHSGQSPLPLGEG
ncbi:hypothetical protein, partial [Pseudomonas koreensis]